MKKVGSIIGICLILQIDLNGLMMALLAILTFIVLLCALIICMQPQIDIHTFKTPFVPFIPIFSVFVNCYMMTTLSAATWIIFLIWFLIGMIIYFGYGIRHSVERIEDVKQNSIFPFIERKNKIKDSTHVERLTRF